MSKAIVLTGFNPHIHRGGIETFTLALISFLEQSGLEVTVHWARQYENCIGLNNDWWGRAYQMGNELARQGESAGSLVFINGYYGFGYRPKVLPAYTLFHSTHFGYAKAIRNLVPESAYLNIRYVVGELMERSAAEGAKVLAVSEGVRQELEQGYGLTDVTCVANPVDTDFFRRLSGKRGLRKKYGLPEDAFIGLYVGRWERAKGIDLVEGLFRQLPKTRWVLALAFGRDSPLPEKENVIIEPTLVEKVKDEEKIIAPIGDISEKSKTIQTKQLAQYKYTLIRFTNPSPPIVGIDGFNYGPFQEDDIANLPYKNSKILIFEKFAEKIDIT